MTSPSAGPAERGVADRVADSQLAELDRADHDGADPEGSDLEGDPPDDGASPALDGRLGSGPRRRKPVPLQTIWAFFRNLWRRLTSMRTALLLLFLLAMASLPGALLPQWSLNTTKTAQYIVDHPTLGPWLDRLGFFEVFASPWYAAIYLLLFTSLDRLCAAAQLGVRPAAAGRPGGHSAQPRPASAPRPGDRSPAHPIRSPTGSPPGSTGRRGRRWRVARRAEPAGTVTLSAERGYLREVGNLVFHLSLLGLLVAVAVGKLFGYEGSVIVTTGQGFCSTVAGQLRQLPARAHRRRHRAESVLRPGRLLPRRLHRRRPGHRVPGRQVRYQDAAAP